MDRTGGDSAGEESKRQLLDGFTHRWNTGNWNMSLLKKKEKENKEKRK